MSLDNAPLSYQDIGREFRRLVANRIRTNPERYDCLTPSHHDKIYPSFEEQKFRFGILPRADVSSRGNGNSFNCGKTRIELFLAGYFDSSGFKLNSSGVTYRWLICPMVATDFFMDSLSEQFKDYWSRGKSRIDKSDYETFVGETLDIVQDNLAVLRNIVSKESANFG